MDFHEILFVSLYSPVFPGISAMTVYSLYNLCEKRKGKGGGVGENARKRNKEEKGEGEKL